MFEDVLGAI